MTAPCLSKCTISESFACIPYILTSEANSRTCVKAWLGPIEPAKAEKPFAHWSKSLITPLVTNPLTPNPK